MVSLFTYSWIGRQQALTRCQKVKSRREREIWIPYPKFQEEKREMWRFVFRFKKRTRIFAFFFSQKFPFSSRTGKQISTFLSSLLEIRNMDCIFLFLFSISLFGILSMPGEAVNKKGQFKIPVVDYLGRSVHEDVRTEFRKYCPKSKSNNIKSLLFVLLFSRKIVLKRSFTHFNFSESVPWAI